MDEDDYRWFEFANEDLPQRFPRDWPWLAGADAWREGVGVLHESSPERVHWWLALIRQAPPKPAARCPRGAGS